MRRISCDKIAPGMKLARSIYSSDGSILLSQGTDLRDNYIKRLIALNIYEVYIEDDISEGIIVEDVISEKNRLRAKTAVRSIMTELQSKKSVNVSQIKAVVNDIVDEIIGNRSIIINLMDLKTVDDYLFGHSVSVSVLSIATGVSLGYDAIKLKDLGVGALLHDVGKSKVPSNILNKPSNLTSEEFEIVKKHTIYGYDILKETKELSLTSCYIALAHHEKVDGNGYPYGLKEEDIHQYAKIVAVADVYDALISDRQYKKRGSIHSAYDYLIGMSNKFFDHQVVKSFLSNIALYPIGTGVLLNTGEGAIVVDINKQFPTRPIIRIVSDEAGQKLQQFKEVDLTRNNSLIIVDTYDF